MDILEDLAALRGFVTPSEVAQFGASEGRSDLPVWEDGQDDAPAALDLGVPEGGPPLKRALDASKEKGFDRKENDALLLKLEVLEALAIGVALAGGPVVELVGGYATEACRCRQDPFPLELAEHVARTARPLVESKGRLALLSSTLGARLLALFRRDPGGASRSVRSKFLRFVRHEWSEKQGAPCRHEPWVPLFFDWAQQQDQVRWKLWADNLRVAVWGMYRSGVGAPDINRMLPAAFEGFEQALDLFEPSMGNKLATYSFHRVRIRVQREQEATFRVLRLPYNQWSIRTGIYRAELDYRRSEGCSPALLELASLCDVSEEVLVSKIASHRLGVYPGSRWTVDGAEPSDFALSREGTTLADLAWLEMVRRFLTMHFERLSERERYILTARFGLEGDEPRTLSEVGTDMGLSRERIRQLEKMAFERLQSELDDLIKRWHHLYGYEPTPSTPPTS